LFAILCLGLPSSSAGSARTHKHFANCTHAVATLDPDKRVIDLRVDCWSPRKAHELGFSVTRFGLDDQGGAPGIRGFDHHPALSGPGAASSHGRCSWYRESVSCQMLANGRMVVHGAIRVRPATRCSKQVSITTAVTTCEGGFVRLHWRLPSSSTASPVAADLDQAQTASSSPGCEEGPRIVRQVGMGRTGGPGDRPDGRLHFGRLHDSTYGSHLRIAQTSLSQKKSSLGYRSASLWRDFPVRVG
jgi:hypothetical protein